MTGKLGGKREDSNGLYRKGEGLYQSLNQEGVLWLPEQSGARARNPPLRGTDWKIENRTEKEKRLLERRQGA